MSDSRDIITGLEVYSVDLKQDRPYLGPLRADESVNEQGYFVRRGNRTVYPRTNRSIVVRLWTKGGVEGWGGRFHGGEPDRCATLA